MLKTAIIIGSLAIAVSGCSSVVNRPAQEFDPVSTNILKPRYGTFNHLLQMFEEDAHCDSLGCGKDLEFYQFEQGEASRRAAACDWDWGQTSSAHAPGTPEYKRLRAEEQAKGTVPGLCTK